MWARIFRSQRSERRCVQHGWAGTPVGLLCRQVALSPVTNDDDDDDDDDDADDDDDDDSDDGINLLELDLEYKVRRSIFKHDR